MDICRHRATPHPPARATPPFLFAATAWPGPSPNATLTILSERLLAAGARCACCACSPVGSLRPLWCITLLCSATTSLFGAHHSLTSRVSHLPLQRIRRRSRCGAGRPWDRPLPVQAPVRGQRAANAPSSVRMGHAPTGVGNQGGRNPRPCPALRPGTPQMHATNPAVTDPATPCLPCPVLQHVPHPPRPVRLCGAGLCRLPGFLPRLVSVMGACKAACCTACLCRTVQRHLLSEPPFSFVSCPCAALQDWRRILGHPPGHCA